MNMSLQCMHVSNAWFIVPFFLLQVSSVFLSPAPPPAPTITDVSFTAGVSFTVEWSETSGSCETVDNFTFNITPNDLSCTRSTMTTVTCSYSRTHLGQMYTFSVAALNCGTQRGDEATITINLQGVSLTKIVKHGHNVYCVHQYVWYPDKLCEPLWVWDIWATIYQKYVLL